MQHAQLHNKDTQKAKFLKSKIQVQSIELEQCQNHKRKPFTLGVCSLAYSLFLISTQISIPYKGIKEMPPIQGKKAQKNSLYTLLLHQKVNHVKILVEGRITLPRRPTIPTTNQVTISMYKGLPNAIKMSRIPFPPSKPHQAKWIITQSFFLLLPTLAPRQQQRDSITLPWNTKATLYLDQTTVQSS